jgi:hypothetical protein
MIDEEIRALETRLLDQAVRASDTELDRLIADDFIEFGASGNVYTKASIIAALNAQPALPSAIQIENFRTRVLASDVVLATYRFGASLRSSLWRRETTDWKVVFHQGTPSPEAR